MSVPDTPAELIFKASEARAREVFEEFDVMTPAMQRFARLLLSLGMNNELTDQTFKDLLSLTLLSWRDANCDRFNAAFRGEEDDHMRRTVRSVEINQFLNQTLATLSVIPELLEDVHHLADLDELDGS